MTTARYTALDARRLRVEGSTWVPGPFTVKLEGGDVRALSLIHPTRVLAIVTLAPVLMYWVWRVDLTCLPGQPASKVGWEQIALLLVTGLVGWNLASRVGLFGASILGLMILAAVLSLAVSNRLTQSGFAPPKWPSRSFLPGVQAEMVVISILAGANLAFVVCHHQLRLVIVILCAPIAARLFGRGP